VFDVIDAPEPVPEPDASAKLPGPPFAVELRAVWAGYPGSITPALRGVSLDLAPGRRIAIVGPSGSGKSTVAAVLLRFLPCEAGSATLNGASFDRISGDQVRTVVGLVGQDAHLFDTTIGENLRIGRRAATDSELHDVIGRVGLSAWLDELPRGLATEVGQHGRRLSGGQRQRMAVARALLADFPVLVLDEPAEHLDPLAADALTADLVTVTQGRSLVLITHRLVGLESLDEILVMDRGQVVERGAHDQLLAEGGRYSNLWWEEMRTERYVDSIDDARHHQRVEPTTPTGRGGRNEGSAER
jgi:ABC-type multidrug transport system fused ATPase/permease subunit